MYVCTHRSQKRVSGPLELKLQIASIWVLGLKPWASQEQPVFLITEMSLQSLLLLFKMTYCTYFRSFICLYKLQNYLVSFFLKSFVIFIGIVLSVLRKTDIITNWVFQFMSTCIALSFHKVFLATFINTWSVSSAPQPHFYATGKDSFCLVISVLAIYCQFQELRFPAIIFNPKSY